MWRKIMVLSSVSGISSNYSNLKSVNSNPEYKINSGSSDSTSFKGEASDEKREEIKKQVKKVYNKGFLTGAALTALLCIGDYFLEHFIANKKSDKIVDSLDFSCFENGKEIKNTTKAASEMRIPFISTIKKLIGRIKK